MARGEKNSIGEKSIEKEEEKEGQGGAPLTTSKHTKSELGVPLWDPSTYSLTSNLLG